MPQEYHARWLVSSKLLASGELTTNMCDSAVFQAGGLVVVLVEVARRNFLASIVPVIVNAVLNGHQIVVDIVAFVTRGDFPRSRLGEKQRGKILGNWVTRKLRTIAQFSIKDDATDMLASEARRSAQSFRNGGTGSSARGASSLQHVESSSALGDVHEDEVAHVQDYAMLPTGVSEMPGMPSPPVDDGGRPSQLMIPGEYDDVQQQYLSLVGETTPTMSHSGQSGTGLSPVEMPGSNDFYSPAEEETPTPAMMQHQRLRPGEHAYVGLPSVDVRGSLMADDAFAAEMAAFEARGGDDWSPEARMHSNLAGRDSPPHGRR